jgi:transmembrane sensor
VRPWLDQDELHRRAWAHIQATNHRLRTLTDPVARTAVLTTEGDQRRKAIKTLALLLFASGSGTLIYRQAPWRESLADVRTGVGERRVVTLVDGSRLDLNSATAVNIEQRMTRLQVTLIAGEIMLTTAADKTVPLVVQTQQGELRPIGTRFSVQQHDDRTEVAVFEGRVAAYTTAAATVAVPSGIVDRGQRGDLFDDHLGELQAADENTTAWVYGMLVASSTPLGEFLQTLSRHRPGYLGWDPAVAALPVSGTYPLADTDRILASLTQNLPIRVQSVTRYWVRVVPAT